MALPAQQTQPQTPATIKALFSDPKIKARIAEAIPKHLNIDRLIRIAVTAISANPKLLKCTQGSLLAAVMGSAILGLETEPFLGQAYIVPYWDGKKKCFEAKLIPGYRGYLTLARRSGEVQSVSVQMVYSNDHFKLQFGLDERLEHIPAEGDRGEPRGAYVIFKYKDGGHSFDYMTVGDIEKHRERSQAKDNGPWVTDTDEMRKKTVIRRHIKVVPLSVEMAMAAAAEEAFNTGDSQLGIFGMEDGGHELPEPSTEAFDSFMENIKETPEFSQYLIECAKAMKMENVAELKASINTREEFISLMNTFQVWVKKRTKQEKTTTKQATEASQTPQDESSGETNGEGQGPVEGITEEQTTYLLAVPDNFYVKAWRALFREPVVQIHELDKDSAAKLIAELKKY